MAMTMIPIEPVRARPLGKGYWVHPAPRYWAV